MNNLKISKINGAVFFSLKVVPGSSKTALAGIFDGMLKIKIAAPAEKGKANSCLIDFLAKKLDIKKKNISIISGKTSHLKKIKISQTSPEYISEKLALESEVRVNGR